MQYDDIEKAKEDTSQVYDMAKKTLHEYEQSNKNLAIDSNIQVQRTEEVEHSLMDKMMKSENIISVLHKLCQAHEVLEEEDDSMVVTAEKLMKVKSQLSLLCNGDLTPKVVGILQQEVKKRMSKIMNDVSDWDSQLQMCYKKIECFGDCDKDLTSKVSTMKILSKEKVKERAGDLANDINKMILFPVIVEGGKCECEVSENERWLRITKVKKCDGDETKRVSQALDEILVTLAFLEDSVIPNEPMFRDEFYSVIYEGFTKCIIEERLACCVPKKVEDFTDYKKVQDAVLEFEETISDDGISSKFPNFDKRLSEFTDNVHLHFANRKRDEIYQSAREVMEKGRNGYYMNCGPSINTAALSPGMDNAAKRKQITYGSEESKRVSTTDTPSGKLTADNFKIPQDPTSPLSLNFIKGDLFCLPDFQVSGVVLKLTSIITDTLKLAACPNITPVGKAVFCHTIDNILKLYQIPSLNPVTTSRPEVSAQFFCDSVYLSHYLVTYPRSSSVYEKLSKDINYIGHACKIMKLGLKTMENSLIELQRTIGTLIKETGGLNGAAKEDKSEVLEMAFIQVVDNLKTYTTAWKRLLPKEFYLNILNKSVDNTLGLVCKLTIELEDISANDSSRLYALFMIIQGQLVKILDDEERSIDWRKFCLLTEMLDESLMSIVEKWEGGVLPPCFRAAEVQGLTRALFQNSDRNAALRSKIKGDII